MEEKQGNNKDLFLRTMENSDFVHFGPINVSSCQSDEFYPEFKVLFLRERDPLVSRTNIGQEKG